MNGAEVLDVAREGIIVFFKAAMPVMLIGLAIGLIISIVQALTQIQEQTLIYVPKIASTFFGLLFFMPFMADALGAYMNEIAKLIIRGG
jgi:flagellar biosynthesis protein FliQ